jgi:hypothetical protein
MHMTNSSLFAMLTTNFPRWVAGAGNTDRINALDSAAQDVLLRFILAEVSGAPTFAERDRYVNDFCAFNISLNQIASELINSRLAFEIYSVAIPDDLRFFFQPPSAPEQDKIVETMKRDGYCLSPISLSVGQMADLKAGLRTQSFRTKGIRPRTLDGATLLAFEKTGGSPSTEDGDTYWLDDMDALVHDPLFMRLAFDPYIIAMASSYLGCPPVHVQTNAWFSFPGRVSKNNLSMNGQLFHQDKEFIKFFKVFIYLSDVGMEQGPHSYVEGSHRDELHRKGVALSERLTDADIGRYYERARIKTVTGSAGSILFGDTSCVHKGESVTHGMRIMLQLEYASSLYLSPVPPFSDISTENSELQLYHESFRKRMISNYNSKLRMLYVEYKASRPVPGPIVRLRMVAGRIKQRFIGR